LVSGIPRDRCEIGKPVLDQRQAAARLLDQVRAQRDCSLIAVDADHRAIGSRENGARIAAGAEGAVDIGATVSGLEVADRMATEHGNVEGRFASESRAVRHHCRAPGALCGACRTSAARNCLRMGTPAPRSRQWAEIATKRFISRTPYRLD